MVMQMPHARHLRFMGMESKVKIKPCVGHFESIVAMLVIHNSPGSHRGQSALSGSQDFRIMNYNHLPARHRNYEIQRYTPRLQMMPPPSAEQIKPGKLDTPLKIIKTVVITIIKS